MNQNNGKKRALEFSKEYGVSELTLDKMKEIISAQGYTLIEFNHISNDDAVSTVLKNLGLTKMAEQSKGFSYVNDQFRLVFVHEGLSDEEKLIVLAHEEGHICCDHFSGEDTIGKDVYEEYEANEFAHYLLKKCGEKKSWFSKHKKGSIIAAVCIVAALTAGGIFWKVSSNKKEVEQDQYYITATGKKYHTKDCIYVKNKSDIRVITEEDLESGWYAPCKKCLPGGTK